MLEESKIETDQGRIISDIVKEYPGMFKVVIYHDSYRLPAYNDNRRQLKKESNATKREDNIHRSLRRTKTTIQDIMACNRFDLWCTFTYNCRNCSPKCDNSPCICSPANCKRYDVNYTSRTLRNWFRNQRVHSPDLKYVAVPEYHRCWHCIQDGVSECAHKSPEYKDSHPKAIHFHCFLSGFHGRMKDSGKKTKYGQTVYNATGYYSGWTEFVRIGERFDSSTFEEDYKRVISYMTKYVVKDTPLIDGRRRFLASEGLNRPVTTVNGVWRLALGDLIKNHQPKFINSYLEVQEHRFEGIVSRDRQTSLF